MKLLNTAARIAAAVVLTAFVGSVAGQETYPNKPIHLIVPYPPGGSNDPMARMIGRKLTERWNQPVIIDNRAGGNTVIGGEALAKSPPDGYTLLLLGSGVLAAALLVPAPYDMIKDFDAVATIAKSDYVLVLHPSVPVSTLQEFIALAKAKPGQINFGTAGVGSTVHLATEIFNVLVGIKMEHVPYKGSGPLISDLIGGQLQVAFQIPIAVTNHVRSGKLKAIAVSGEARLAALREVPTFIEAGVPGFDAKAWYGVIAPAGTPKAVINRLSAEIAGIVAMPDTREYLAKQGMEVLISTPDQAAALMRAELIKFGKVIKSANIKLAQ